MSVLASQVLAALPQTQCTRCGYPDCATYAEAIALGTAGINQCPPGGTQGIEWLAAITGQPIKALNPAHGAPGPRAVAYIREERCIGCTLCINACPTDAILGSNKLMHTVIEAYCTGCERCIPVCPMDCIALENVTQTATGWSAWSRPQAELARARYDFHRHRHHFYTREEMQRVEVEAQAMTTNDEQSSQPTLTSQPSDDKKRALIETMLKRARAQRDALR